jgi:hypothetical protein
MTISEEIDQIIAENGGRERDAINVLLARNKQANQTIEYLLDLMKHGLTEQDLADTDYDEPKVK